MPDICLVCGQFDHLSENDCPTAIEMRLNHGVVIKKYLIRIKAESPRFKARRFEGNDGSFRLGGSGSRRSTPLSARSGPSRQTMGGGRAAQLSSSIGYSRRHIRPHVDRRVVEPNLLGEKSTGMVEKNVEAATDFSKEVEELYGDLGLPESQGVGGDFVVGDNYGGGNVQRKAREDEGASGS
ncbi:hypothetical protein COLO4_10208 [Corchorus olitorius]|uniref:Zinc knuckle CX2CX4HX4C n=1 Tax=Corchorus olitorius TaxID=93759 RepID=A0A1R3K9K6_9ROSI|nr:hypothetical protein COLO4_10208 [Corchorus olitorius]